MKRNLFLWIEYEGTAYCGWQRQANGPTVQQQVEQALADALGEPVKVCAAGRTDAGVHALGQAAHCFVQSDLPVRAIHHRANHALPDDVVIRRVADAPAEFNARRHARLRHYRYRIVHGPVRPAVDRYTWTHIRGRLDLSRIEQAVAVFEGEHEFAAFRSSACRAKRTRLTMVHSSLTLAGNQLIFDFACRSFLHNMIRILVGTALDVGRGRLSLAAVERLLEGKGDRSQAGRTAPPQGLFLVGIEYAKPYEGFNTLLQRGL